MKYLNHQNCYVWTKERGRWVSIAHVLTNTLLVPPMTVGPLISFGNDATAKYSIQCNLYM